MEASGDEQIRQELVERLARIEGQVRGVSKMIQEQRSCDQVLMQIMAARAALEKVAGVVVEHTLDECLHLPPEQARKVLASSLALLLKV